MPSTLPEAAAAAAERIRKAIGGIVVSADSGQTLTVTVSAGVACANPDDAQAASALYRRADQALYQAKELGRDRVSSLPLGKSCLPLGKS